MARNPLERVSILLLVLAVALGISACGEDEKSDPSAARTAGNGDVYNDADVEFATGMIPHHAQAIEMVVLAQDRPLDPEVARLRDQVREAQVPEVETMTDWLTSWGEEVPATSLDHGHAEHGTGGMEDMEEMPGMMTAEEMEELEQAPDGAFQELWLQMMIEHHEGAIEMAQTEQRDGEFPDAIALAEAIESGQQAEIELMEGLLAT